MPNPTRRHAVAGLLASVGSAIARPADATISRLRIRGKAGVLPGSFPKLPAAMIGINEGILTAGKPNDWSRDVYYNCQWRGPDNSYDDGSMLRTMVGGFPTSYKTGQTSLILELPPMRSAARAGTYTVSYPAAMTCSLYLANGATQVQPFANGTGKISLPSPGALNVFTLLKFTGPIPSAGVVVSITKDGDTGTGIYSADAIAAHKALGKINRSMSARGVNSDVLANDPAGPAAYPSLRSAALRYRGNVPDGRLCVEMQVDCCNGAGQHMWHNQSHIDDDTLVAAEAAYVAANLNPAKAVFVELSNELWNTGFQQSIVIKCMGARLGFAPAAATPPRLGLSTAAVPETIMLNSVGNNPVTQFNSNPGDKLFMAISGYGWVVVQAQVAVAAGTTVSLTGTAKGSITLDGNWRYLYDTTDTARAAQRWIGMRAQRVWNIWDTAMIAAGRPRTVHVLGHQAVLPIASFVQNILDWDSTWQMTDRVAIAPYWGGPGAYDLGAYSTNFPSPPYNNPWTATQKDLVASNQAAFMSAFFAAAQDAVASALGIVTSRQAELAAYVASKGAAAGSIKICSYESNWHTLFAGYPTADQTGWAANGGVHMAIMRDARFGSLCSTYYGGLAALGGEHIAFDRIGPPITGYPNGQNSWSLQTIEGDQPPSYLALAAVNAAN